MRLGRKSRDHALVLPELHSPAVGVLFGSLDRRVIVAAIEHLDVGEVAVSPHEL